MLKQIIAHRGAPRLAHENTLEAFTKALELKVDAIELDVRKTRSQVLAVFHDPEIENKKLNSITFSELNQIALSQGFQVPTLEQALNLITGKAQVQIEIKDLGSELEIAESILKILEPKHFVIVSFNFESLKKIKIKYPQIKVGLILGSRGHHFLQTLSFLLHKKHYLSHLDLLAIDYKLWQWNFAKIIPVKYPITVWTVDEPELIARLLKDERIEGITSNVADVAMKIRNNSPSV